MVLHASIPCPCTVPATAARSVPAKTTTVVVQSFTHQIGRVKNATSKRLRFFTVRDPLVEVAEEQRQIPSVTDTHLLSHLVLILGVSNPAGGPDVVIGIMMISRHRGSIGKRRSKGITMKTNGDDSRWGAKVLGFDDA